MSKKLLLGAGLIATALALPAFAMVLPDRASPRNDAPIARSGTLQLAALKLSAPETVAAAPSPALVADADDSLPPVEITGPAR